MQLRTDERIRVGVIYGAEKKAAPVWFMWKGTKYSIEEITYYWQDRKGREPLHYFSVTDGDNLFKLCFNGFTLNWHLLEVHQQSP